MHIMSTNFGKTLVWKYEYEVKLCRHKRRTPNTNDHHMPLNETPPRKFFAYATASGTRTSSCFCAMDRNFGSVFLPSVIHGFAPVIADVNLRKVGLAQMVDRMAGGIMLLWSQRDISLNFLERKLLHRPVHLKTFGNGCRLGHFSNFRL